MVVPVELPDSEFLVKSASTTLNSKVVSQYSTLLAPLAVDSVLSVVDPDKPDLVDLRDIKIVKKLVDSKVVFLFERYPKIYIFMCWKKTNRQKVLEVEKLSSTIKELEEVILAGGEAANKICDFLRQISELQEEKRTLERELARVKVLASRVASVVVNEWKDKNEKVMPVNQWLEERKLAPIVKGSSVIAIKYKDDILMAADMGGSYGSTLRYKSLERIKPVGKHSLVGASGEISDFQETLRYLDELIISDNMWDDGNSLGPKEVHNYLVRVMYKRRNKFNRLWNTLVLGGVKNGQKYIGMVNMIKVHYEDSHIATGLGNHLSLPILRDECRQDLSFEFSNHFGRFLNFQRS